MNHMFSVDSCSSIDEKSLNFNLYYSRFADFVDIIHLTATTLGTTVRL